MATQDELISSIVNVQKSCLTTLNDLLSTSSKWRPIVPDRRHSMPSPRSPHALSALPTLHSNAGSSSLSSTLSSISPLQTLVLNLRAQESEVMTECLTSDLSDEASLVRELDMRVERLSSTQLSPRDAALAQALVSLVAQFRKLAELHPKPTQPRAAAVPRTASWSTSPAETAPPLVTLQRQLSDLQLARGGEEVDASRPPVQAVETALLWARVDQEFERILELCSQQPCAADIDYGDHLPPEYDEGEYGNPFESDAELPLYEEGDGYAAFAAKKTKGDVTRTREPSSATSTNAGVSEKMRMDLEAVALAIDRLYLVAPQLHDQRVELKKSKREQMERARMAGPSKEREREQERDKEKIKARPGKERASDVGELEKMVELIGRASERKFADQVVVLDSGRMARLEQAQRGDQEKREAFVTRLVRHSDAGRLHSQDAVLPNNKVKDPEAMLTLPEFIRESVPQAVQLKMQMEDPKALLSLPEFVREPLPEHLNQPTPRPPPLSRKKSFKGMRSRSMSAPPLAWLLPSSSTSPRAVSPSTPPEGKEVKESKRSRLSRSLRPGSSSGIATPQWQAGLDVHYVAEYHETLQHVLVFMDIQGGFPGLNLEAEVVPVSESSTEERSRLLLKCGTSTSPLLALPAPVSPGVKEVKVMGRYHEVKLPISALPSSPVDASPALLDATQLSSTAPTSFACASCSLPLVQASRLREYRDLPSEHWAELVDAWMCHSDQRLHDQVQKHTREGFWPREGEALVGGSYILFEESAVVQSNLLPPTADDRKVQKVVAGFTYQWSFVLLADGVPLRLSEPEQAADGWWRTRCLCGAIIGRCQERPSSPKAPPVKTYRLAKYAVRPLSTSSDALRLPLSAFIAEDMNEFVHAHATYRFVIFDEEEERPRILVWLFKPSLRLSYTVPTQYVIPKSGSIRAAKVLFKILDTAAAYSDLPSLLKRYPGFPQAEHLYYPRGVCRRIGALLRESNTAYPENMRTMTGLDVGWLQRA
ncbi:hypothetical protein BN946_scf184600.g5 [Trametes cinnabarina]|uniref:HECT-like ubiquitin-conjugating enzyme-binding-domain-containing protein n=1 Tax=Pycnoporus cinnabarinus TaxID=5643 RepID=A0A060SQL2_PYCCI|nr:hypothetical protein BN946_scf184600.g5 [Trametes cinnabarina]